MSKHDAGAQVIRVILADDHALVTEGLRSLIDQQDDMTVVAAVEDGDELLALLEKPVEVDVTVLDLQMPFSGFDVLRALRERGTRARVLVLTAFADGESVQTALSLGASGFALKTEPPKQTIEAIRQVMRGQLVFPQSARRWMAGQNEVGESNESKGPARLSPREREVLAQLAQGHSNSQIAAALSISENTVRFHLKNVYEKLEVTNRTEAATWFLRDGG